MLFFVLWIIPFDIIVFIFKKLSVLYVKSHYLEFEEETDEEIEQDIADDPEDHNDNIPYAEESDFEDDTIYTEERKPIPKIIPKKKKAPFNVEAFAKECNAYVVKQERQEEQENLQHWYIFSQNESDPVFDQPLSYVIKSTASTQSPTVAIVIYDIRQKKGG